MTETPTKVIIDLSKPEGQRETIVPLTPEELEQRELDRLAWEAQEAERLAAEQAKAEAQASAVAKLEALGLTAEEIAALKG
jgi:hypothetical protein